MKLCASTCSSNMIIKVEKLVEYDSKSLTFDECVRILSPTLTDKPLISHFSCGDLNTINSVFESLIFNLLVITYLLISARQLNIKGLLGLFTEDVVTVNYLIASYIDIKTDKQDSLHYFVLL